MTASGVPNDAIEMHPVEPEETGGRERPVVLGPEPEEREVVDTTLAAGDVERGSVELLPERECPFGAH